MMTTVEQLLALVPATKARQTVRLLRTKPPAEVDAGNTAENEEMEETTELFFTIRPLTYNQIADLRERENKRDAEVHTVLLGMVSPNLKDASLQEALDVRTPIDAIKNILLAGEISELAMRIEQLSGFRKRMTEIVEDVQKN